MNDTETNGANPHTKKTGPSPVKYGGLLEVLNPKAPAPGKTSVAPIVLATAWSKETQPDRQPTADNPAINTMTRQGKVQQCLYA